MLKPTNTNYLFKFSIVTAVYNVAPYLSEAIDSILSQDIGFLESVELILVDDGSTDASGAICDEYQHKYPENIVVIHKPNGGVASARNAGIAVARGRYVNFMDSDDKLTPDTLSSVYDFFIEHDKEVDLVSVPIFYFEQKNEPHRLNYKYASDKAQVIDLTTHYSYVQMSSASSLCRRFQGDHGTTFRESPIWHCPTGVLPVSCPYIHEFCPERFQIAQRMVH